METKSVHRKLLEIQSKLKAPKGQYNSFGKYHYRNCEDILEAVKPILVEQKTILILSDTVEVVEGRYYIKATVRLIDVETGEEVSNTALAREEDSKKGMDGSQITGASSSYARKYALNGLFCIDDTKDSDNTNTGSKVVCMDCGNTITGNDKLTAAQIVWGTKNSYGRELCSDCGKKIKDSNKNQNEGEQHE